MTPIPPQASTPLPFATLKVLWSYVWPADRIDLKKRVMGAAFFLMISKACNLGAPFFFKLSVDLLSQEKITLLYGGILMIVGYGLCRVFSQAFNETKDFLFAKVTQNAVRTLGLQTFNKLHRLSLGFHLEKKTGYISRVIEKGGTSIESFLRFSTFNLLPTLVEILLVVGVLSWIYGIIFAAIIMITLVAYILFTLLFTEWRTRYVRMMNQMDSEASGKAIDSLLNYETIKYFGSEGHESRRYNEALKSYEKAAIKSYQTLSFLNIGQGVIISLGLMMLMILAAQHVALGQLTTGDFVLLNTYLIQLYLPLSFLGFAYREIKLSLLNMDIMFQTLKEPEAIHDHPDCLPLSVDKGRIEFNHVSFAYHPDRAILKDVSFVIEPGQTVAVVGSSGAGKSTLSRLLFRFYDVQSGQIMIDGQNITDVQQDSLRAHIGMVPQDTVLFNDTILYNIAYGKEGASQDQIIAAARQANIHTFIESLPQGYQTLVGERGLKLSGGEKQRVAIARTLLKNPPILVFDEATSALDSHTEREIQQAIFELCRTKTTLIIAHRLSTIVSADLILVMEGGRLMEAGTHTQLLTKEGLYYNLWSRQTKNHLWDDQSESLQGSEPL